ncbi:hypothetical protein niasHT_009699 [Heterodera trifolii]|uniref:Uncharacterized protein n=1 Tax=Heterodera trifolii TaxID=157864 RepID=A0ABD2MDJ5_9BILA
MDHAWRPNKNIILHDEFQNSLALNMDAGNNNLEDENSESMVDIIHSLIPSKMMVSKPRIGIIQGINNPAISSWTMCPSYPYVRRTKAATEGHLGYDQSKDSWVLSQDTYAL